MHFSKDRSFYKLLLSIALPIAAQNLLTFSIGMADSVMVGFLGELQLSAASIGNRFFFIMMITLFGITGGSNVLIAQYWGKKDTEAIHKVMSIMYRVVLVVCGVFFVIARFFPEWAMRLYVNDVALIAEGSIYLQAISLSYILFALTNSTIMVLRSVRTVQISNLIYGTSLTVNVFFNWVLIFGKLGAPALGIAGAAYATVLARFSELLVLAIFLWRYEDKLHIRLHKYRLIDKLMVSSFISNVLPVMANEAFWVAGNTVVQMITGRLGAAVIAAGSIDGILWQLVTIALFGLQNATAVIVGNTIGAGETEKLKDYTDTIMSLAFIIAPLVGLIMFLLRPLAISLYPNFDSETLYLAMRLMQFSSIILLFQVMNFITLMGILRGGGDLRFVLVADVIFLWTVSIPLGLAAAYYWHLPPYYIVLLMRSDEVLKSIISVWRVKKGNWVRNLTM